MERIRLDRFLTECGVISRETAKKSIRSGVVTVNGETVRDPGTHVSDTDEVTVSGTVLQYQKYCYLILHKPAGFLTASTDRTHRTVTELLPEECRGLAPVGRLDLDAEGLLLFTNDGETAHRLISPKSGIEKIYYVRTDGRFPEDAAKRLSEPIAFSDFTSKPAKTVIISENEAYLTLTEGKFHEVKRLVHTLGIDVVYLKRVSFGPLTLGDLETGACRMLSDEEIRTLKESIGR